MEWNKVKILFMKDSVPNICNDKNLLQKAFVRSKSTIIKDFEKSGGVTEMSHLDFSEFLELIARVAHLQSQKSPQLML